MDSDDTPASSPNPPSLSLAAASRFAGVSQPTLRKHLQAGRLEAEKDSGHFGTTWQIDPVILTAFVLERYGRELDVSSLTPEPGTTLPPQDVVNHENAVELRQRLEDTLQELGKYRALVEASDAADRRVEDLLGARIAELQQERDAAQAKADEAAAELARVKARGFWARVFGSGNAR